MLEIKYTSQARKDLERLGHVAAARILAKIEAYAENPRAHANNVKKLQALPALRLRVGDYRVIFTADGIVLQILKVGHRREIYD